MTQMHTDKLREFERRQRIIYIKKHQVLDVVALLYGKASPEHFVLDMRADVPAGCWIREVFFDHPRNAFGFVLIHESFEPVADGGLIPILDEAPTLKTVEVHVFRGTWPPAEAGSWSSEPKKERSLQE